MRDFIDLMPLMHWLHQAVPKSATEKYLAAMQRVFYAHSIFTQHTDQRLTYALDNLLRALANSAEFDGYTHGKLATAFESIQGYLKSIGEENHLGDKYEWNIHELLTIPTLQLEQLATQRADGNFDYHAIRLISALLQHGKSQSRFPQEFCELPGAVTHEFGDYLALALSSNLGFVVPYRLDQIYTGDIRDLCEVAWKNFDRPIELKFYERHKLLFAIFFK